jgi:iron complex transport system substrate-binding protein
MISSAGHNITDFQIMRDDLMSRTALGETTAVQKGDVYIIDSYFRTGTRNPLGLLTLAKLFHPDLFADIDPTAIHEEMIQTFFGVNLKGTYAYPEIVTVTDATGTQVTVRLPVNRVISLSSGLTEILCALGGEDLIVGRGQYCTFPPSIVEKPVVGSTSSNPNVELLLEKEPDLVIADTMLAGKPQLSQIQSAGIPVIIEAPAALSRIILMIHTFGIIVDTQENATNLIEWMNHYLGLVNERTANISSNEKLSVYSEYNTDWSGFGPQHAVGELMSIAGGVNIITDSSVNTITVSPEFVLEQNPDAIFKMTASVGTADVTFYQDKMNALIARTGFSEVTAVKEGHVYLYSYSLIQGIRYPVGLLYFAKCLYPTLFADIDPTAVLAELTQRFFGVDLEGVYVYP